MYTVGNKVEPCSSFGHISNHPSTFSLQPVGVVPSDIRTMFVANDDEKNASSLHAFAQAEIDKINALTIASIALDLNDIIDKNLWA